MCPTVCKCLFMSTYVTGALFNDCATCKQWFKAYRMLIQPKILVYDMLHPEQCTVRRESLGRLVTVIVGHLLVYCQFHTKSYRDSNYVHWLATVIVKVTNRFDKVRVHVWQCKRARGRLHSTEFHYREQLQRNGRKKERAKLGECVVRRRANETKFHTTVDANEPWARTKRGVWASASKSMGRATSRSRLRYKQRHRHSRTHTRTEREGHHYSKIYVGDQKKYDGMQHGGKLKDNGMKAHNFTEQGMTRKKVTAPPHSHARKKSSFCGRGCEGRSHITSKPVGQPDFSIT